MNPPPSLPASRASARRALFWVGLTVCVPLVAVGGTIMGIASYFHLSSDTRALREGLMEASEAEWHQQIGLNIGSFTFGAVRTGLTFLDSDPEARAAISAMRGAEVGIYELASQNDQPDGRKMLVAADQAMTKRGWERVVGVLHDQDLVGVYLPAKEILTDRVKCCVLVFDGHHLVLVRADANLEPLMELLKNHPQLRANLPTLATR